MIGLVVVSHSSAVATAAAELAREMVPDGVRVELAAGTAEGGFGTDALRISQAIEAADSGDGVLVLMDLGSAVLSAEMACEFLDPDLAERVRLSSAPLLEGLLVAVVSASGGASLAEVAEEAEAALGAKREHLGPEPEPPAPDRIPDEPAGAGPDVLTGEVTITNPHGLHARPVAALVAALREFDAVITLSNQTTGRGPVPATSVTKVATLGVTRGQVLGVSARGPEAERAIAALVELAADQFGERESGEREEPGSSAKPAEPAPESSTGSTTQSQPHLTGRQIVIAPAFVPADHLDLTTYVPGADETTRAAMVVDDLRRELGVRAQREHGDIFGAQLALLDDLVAEVREHTTRGSSAAVAIDETLTRVADEFDQLADPHLRERAQDIRSLRRQLLTRLMHPDAPAASAGGESTPHVLVVTELDAVTAATLDPSLTTAVVTLTGGSTGHGVLVASSRGIPVVTGQSQVRAHSGETMAVDPVSQQVWVSPSEDDLADLRNRAAERESSETAARTRTREPALTRAGAQITVKANVSNLTDARAAAANGADGSGLVRTELLFGDWSSAPTAREQADALIAIGQALGGQPITVRTWDAGADKPLRFIEQAPEANPFLGERGVRTMRRVPEVFDEQLRGIVLAHRETPVRVMLPMVTTPDEVLWAKRRLEAVTRELGGEPVPLGMMVEVPAAAIRSGDFVDLVDFASIGTNDLTQYVTATDRSNASLQHLTKDAGQAVLDLVTMTCLGMMGLPVCVCGDLASDLDAVPRLIAAGVTELSVRPTLIGLVKQAVRET